MKTKTFQLTLTTALAASLSACGPSPSGQWDDGYTEYANRDTAVCVDQRTKERIADYNCERRRSGGGSYWHYYRSGQPLPYLGDRASGGSAIRPQGVRSFYHAPASTAVTRSAAISRGGFSSSSHSSFGG